MSFVSRRNEKVTEPKVLAREELYEMVWSEPITRIAKRLGASDVAISKICRKMNVPRPPRGHWARAQHGYPTIQPPLPKAKPDTPREWVLTPQGRRQTFSQSDVDIPTIRVPEKLGKPHPKLIAIRTELREARRDEYGRVCSSYRLIHVTKASISRSLRLLTALFRTLEQRGHSISENDSGITICAAGEEFRVSLYEAAKRIPHPNPSDWGYPKWAYVPTERLELTLSVPGFYRLGRQWSDTAKRALEERLGEVVLTIEGLPTLISAQREVEYLDELRRARASLVRRRRQDRIRLTHQRAEAVDQLAKDLERARQIRALIAEIEAQHEAPIASKRIARWAGEYADHIDPLQSHRIAELDQQPRDQDFRFQSSWE